jgi:hypothetical protein
MLYNHTTEQLITRAEIIEALPSITRKNIATDDQLVAWAAEHLGWTITEVQPFATPEGMVAVPPMSIVVEGGVARKEYATITLEEHEAQQQALADQAESEAAQRAHDRILGLVDAYGADIAIMGRLLAVFGLTFPCEPADVITLIKGGLATGQIPLDKAPFADTLEARYKEVREAMTDAEIAQVAAILEAQQG